MWHTTISLVEQHKAQRLQEGPGKAREEGEGEEGEEGEGEGV